MMLPSLSSSSSAVRSIWVDIPLVLFVAFTWSQIAAQDCTSGCPDLTIANGKSILYTRTENGVTNASVQFFCNPDYKLIGTSSLVCRLSNATEKGFVNGEKPSCAVTQGCTYGCPNLTIANGKGIMYTRTENEVTNASVQFFCNPGYKMNGTSNLECRLSNATEKGFVNGEKPTCVAEDCGDPVTIEHGTREFNATTVFNKAIYKCNSGYSLQGVKETVCQTNKTWSPQPGSCGVKCHAQLPMDFLSDSHHVTSKLGVPKCGHTAADIIVVCDESESMKPGRKAKIDKLIRSLDQELEKRGIGLYQDIPNQYTLIGFGSFYNTSQNPNPQNNMTRIVMSNTNRKVYNISGFREACEKLQSMGSQEDGYLAMKYALENVTDGEGRPLLRLNQAHVAPIIIFISDEDRDEHQHQSVNRHQMKRMIRRSGAMLEVIVDNYIWYNDTAVSGFGMDATGKLYSARDVENYTITKPEHPKHYLQTHYKNTYRHYSSMALELGGAVWDLKSLLRQKENVLYDVHLKAFVTKTASLVEERVHKCCKCHCDPETSLLEWSVEENAEECSLGKPDNVFKHRG